MVKISQEAIRNCFGVGQTVLVRRGKDWVSREILFITVLRNNTYSPERNPSILGEPRFWFKDYGNIPLENIMAKEDIDPDRLVPAVNLGKIDFKETLKEAEAKTIHRREETEAELRRQDEEAR